MTRKLLKKKKTQKNQLEYFDLKELAKKMNVSRDYIYQIMMMNIEPNEDFIEKINQLKNE